MDVGLLELSLRSSDGKDLVSTSLIKLQHVCNSKQECLSAEGPPPTY